MPKHARRSFFFRHAVALLLLCGLLAAAFPLFADQSSPSASASSQSPALEWFLDRDGTRSLSAMLAPEAAQQFEPVPQDGFPNAAGTVWLRFVLPTPLTGEPCLDLNERLAGQLPGGVEAWVVRRAPGTPPGPAPEELKKLVSGLYLLPKVSEPNAMVYLKVPGVPSPGFIPVIRDRDAVTTLGLDGLFWPQIVMGLLLILCLVRGVMERREWRLLSGLYLAAALVSLAWGVPGTPGGLPDPQSLPGLLAPGIALLLLPHAGRQMMQTADTAPNLDLALTSVGIAGLLLALTPLVPHAEGFVRLLALWPMGMLLCWPIAVIALLRWIPGSRLFALAVILPPLGFLPLWFDIPGKPDFIKLLPFLTACLSALGLALLPSPRHPVRAIQRRAATSAQPADDTPPASTLVIQDLSAPRPEVPERDPLKERLNALNKELNTLFEHPLQPALRMRIRLLADALTTGVRTTPGETSPTGTFSLHEVILEAHNAVSATAERQNLALTWYVAPQLSRQYVGDRAVLTRTLTELLLSAIRATARGGVQLRAQRLPESNDPGMLLFTVSDTGTDASPDKRDPAALLHAWELAGRLGGSLGLTSGPTGTTVKFVIRLQPAAESGPVPETARQPELKAALSSALRVLIVSDVPASRQLLAYYLDELPHELREARSTGEALAMYAQAPGALVILDGDLPESDLMRFIAQLRAFEGEHALPPASILGLTSTEAQADQLRRAGCTHTLSRPVQRTELRHLVLRLAPLPRQRSAATRPSVERPRPDGKRKLSATSITVDPSAQNDGWMLLPEHDVLKEERRTAEDSAPQSETAAPDQTPVSAEPPLRFLQPPTLSVRSNVGEPMPVSKPAASSSDKAPEPDASSQAAAAGQSEPARTPDEQPLNTLPPTGSRPGTDSDTPAGGSASIPPIKPVRIQAVSRIPQADSTAPKPRSVRAVPYLPGSATSGLSPWTGSNGDWVGDPMPLTASATPPDTPPAPANPAEQKAPVQPASKPSTPSSRDREASPQGQPVRPQEVSDAPTPVRPAQPAPSTGRGGPAAGDPLSLRSASQPSAEEPLPPSGTHFGKKRGLFGKLTGLFGSKPPRTDAFDLAPAPADRSAAEWVGEPMPLQKVSAPDSPDAANALNLADTPAPESAPGNTPPRRAISLNQSSRAIADDQEPGAQPSHPAPAQDAGLTCAPLSPDPDTPDGLTAALAATLADRDAAAPRTPHADEADAPIELTDLAGPQQNTALPELFPSGSGLTDRVMPMPLMPDKAASASETETAPRPAAGTPFEEPLELRDFAQPILPELTPAGKGRSATVMTLPYAPEAFQPAPHGLDATPPAPAQKAPAEAPLSLRAQAASAMPSLTVEPADDAQQKESVSPIELTDRIAPDMPELRMDSAPLPELSLAQPAPAQPLTTDPASSPRVQGPSSASSPTDTQALSEPASPADAPLPLIELDQPLPDELDESAPSPTAGSPLADTEPPVAEPQPHPEAAHANTSPDRHDATPPAAEVTPLTHHETADLPDDDMTNVDSIKDLDVTALLNTLDALEHALREAALRNDVPALRGVSNTMATTADALRLPTLADLARCLAESDDESREALLEATLEAARQARQ